MLPLIPSSAAVEPQSYPLGENREPSNTAFALALVSLSHTPVEQRIYAAMLASALAGSSDSSFTARELISITGIRSPTTLRRALDGLLVKLSIERAANGNGNGNRAHGIGYRVYTPVEILSRRKQNGFGNGNLDVRHRNQTSERAIERVAANPSLSRREAQVALCCVEGLTNADIGKRLAVSEQTVKFHLRHVFVKFGVKRRAELISKLLM
ncbi:MAG TPA: helix-turn-helix transcriptional regulator [Pyrinomonadaceae bacterium]|nr:helix-turn-helix transcriptional regulator [Pyrinomonadaceae bacterium]